MSVGAVMATRGPVNGGGAAAAKAHATEHLKQRQFARTLPLPVQGVLAQNRGEPLDGAARSFMESRFNANFSDVRIHDAADARESARAIGARAYTVANNIVFADGRPAPRKPGGQRLLAHELAHVVQQRRGGAEPVQSTSAAHEIGARAAASAVVARGNGPVTVGGATGIGLARAGDSDLRAMADEDADFEDFGGDHNERKRAKQRDSNRRQDRQERGEMRRTAEEKADSRARKKLGKLDQAAAAPGASSRSQKEKERQMRRHEEAVKGLDEARVTKNQRNGAFYEALNTPKGSEAQPKFVAGMPELPGMDLQPERRGGRDKKNKKKPEDAGPSRYTQPDYTQSKGGQRKIKELKSNNLRDRTPAQLRRIAGAHVAQAKSRDFHLPTRPGAVPGGVQGDPQVIRLRPGLNAEERQVMLRKYFGKGSPVQEVHFGSNAVRRSEWKDDPPAAKAKKKGKKPSQKKSASGKKSATPASSKKAAARSSSGASKKGATDKTGAASAAGKAKEHSASAKKASTKTSARPPRPGPDHTWVKPHKRKDGTAVSGHWRAAPGSSGGGTPSAETTKTRIAGSNPPASGVRIADEPKQKLRFDANGKARPVEDFHNALNQHDERGSKSGEGKQSKQQALPPPQKAQAPRIAPGGKTAAPTPSTPPAKSPSSPPSAPKAKPTVPPPSPVATAPKAAPSQTSTPPQRGQVNATPVTTGTPAQHATKPGGPPSTPRVTQPAAKAPSPASRVQAPRGAPKAPTAAQPAANARTPSANAAPPVPGNQVRPSSPPGRPNVRAVGGTPTGAAFASAGHTNESIKAEAFEVPGKEPKRFAVRVQVSLGGSVTASASQSGKRGSVGAHAEASAGVTWEHTYIFSEEETKAYLAAVDGQGASSYPEVTAAKLWRSGNREAATAMIQQLKQGGQSVDAVLALREGETSQMTTDAQAGGGVSGSVKALSVDASTSVATQNGWSRARQQGLFVLTRHFTIDQERSVGAAISPGLLSMGYRGTSGTTNSIRVIFEVADDDPGVRAKIAAILAVGSIEDLEKLAISRSDLGGTIVTSHGTSSGGMVNVGDAGGNVNLELGQHGTKTDTETRGPDGEISHTFDATSTSGGDVKIKGREAYGGKEESGLTSTVRKNNTAEGRTSVNRSETDVGASTLQVINPRNWSSIGRGDMSSVIKTKTEKAGATLTDENYGTAIEKAKTRKDWEHAWGQAPGSMEDYEAWVKLWPAMRRAGNDREAVAKILQDFKSAGDDRRRGIVEKALGVSTGQRYEFPDSIKNQKEVFDDIVVSDPRVYAQKLEAAGKRDAALAELKTKEAELQALSQKLTDHRNEYAGGALSPGVFMAMQRRINVREIEVKSLQAQWQAPQPADPAKAAEPGKPDAARKPEDPAPAAVDEKAMSREKAITGFRSNRAIENQVFATMENEFKPGKVLGVELPFASPDSDVLFKAEKNLKDLYQQWEKEIEEYEKISGDPAQEIKPNKDRARELLKMVPNRGFGSGLPGYQI